MRSLEPLPSAGDEVHILAEDDDGRRSEIECVYWPNHGWTNARTLLRGDVLGWRPPPFPRAPAPVDYSSRLREKLAAEMARRFGDR